jgi:general secretion pathway protein B
VPVHALPEPQRSRVQQLAIGGAVHSTDRRQRFVIIDGQIVREGDAVSPGLILERIELRVLMLRLGEQLVELPL